MSFTVRSMVASWPLAGDAVTVSRTSLGTHDRTDSSVFLNGMTSKPMVSKALFSEARTAGSRTVMGRITGCLLSVRRNGAVQNGTPRCHTHRDRRHLPGGQRYGGSRAAGVGRGWLVGWRGCAGRGAGRQAG